MKYCTLKLQIDGFLKILTSKDIRKKAGVSGEKAKPSQKQQDTVQIGHTQLLTFPKKKKTSSATAFSQSESRQTDKDSTAPNTNEVQLSVFFCLFRFLFLNHAVSGQSTSCKTGYSVLG